MLGDAAAGGSVIDRVQKKSTKKTLKKSHIRETPNLSTDADNSTNIFFGNKKFKKIQTGTTPCF